MKSGEILDKFGMTYRQLYYWTTSGFLGDDRKMVGNGGIRQYTEAEVKVLSRMLDLVQAGVTVPYASKIAKGDEVATALLAEALERCCE